jgi:hypothetical protein
MLYTSPAFYLYLSYGKAGGLAEDDVISIVPEDPTDMATTMFNIKYKIAHGNVHRWTCPREALLPYLSAVIRSAAADASVDRFTNIQISPPAFPSLMKLIPMPSEVEKTNNIIQLLHDQLNVLVSSGVWPSF